MAGSQQRIIFLLSKLRDVHLMAFVCQEIKGLLTYLLTYNALADVQQFFRKILDLINRKDHLVLSDWR